MRVTTSSTYRNFTTSVNNVHFNLNKSMNKVSTGEAYENAAESPLNYYSGKKIDNQYQDTLNKISLIKSVQNRIYQQELGARDIQKILSGAKNQVQFARTGTTTDYALESTRDDLYQKQYEIIDALNMEYEGFFIYGGNDVSVTPFTLKYDRDDPTKPFTFTYSHTFPGESSATEFEFKLTYNAADGTSEFKLQNPTDTPLASSNTANSTKTREDLLLQAMSEQGRVDIGYGSIQEKDTFGSRDTLLDTYTGGINLLTGITSDAVKTQAITLSDVEEALTNSSLGLIGRSIQTIDYNIDAGRTQQTQSTMHEALGDVITRMTESEHLTSTVYSDLGNKYRLLEDTKDKLDIEKISLMTQYKDKLGADPYESIIDMYNHQYSYNAALQVGSKLMSSSLFDFMA
ncbi:MAG: flagellar hook-basal body protein [Hungatella sp.]|nr:flagellar hook-basal body protein [Hungatella sp.]